MSMFRRAHEAFTYREKVLLAVLAMAIVVLVASFSLIGVGLSRLQTDQNNTQHLAHINRQIEGKLSTTLKLTTTARVNAVKQRCILTSLIIDTLKPEPQLAKAFVINHNLCLKQLSRVEGINNGSP